ncbi:type II toxin-antitoxin system VapC family toxin [Microtetraspora malaysiensis]|uniref:type II toxin-antitoxin system VapC family toxin n=1 Tax=Microtetraspora malaysiensis TaxID=161358 RepID=UPI003D8FCDFA
MATSLRVVGDRVTMVDSCVLLDIATDDPKWADWSDQAVAWARDRGRVVINPVIYAEVSVGFPGIEAVDAALPSDDFEREDIPYEAAFLAGRAHLAYRRRGGERRSPLPDFFIGAHAAVRNYTLLTRDGARYRTYFPTLDLVTP